MLRRALNSEISMTTRSVLLLHLCVQCRGGRARPRPHTVTQGLRMRTRCHLTGPAFSTRGFRDQPSSGRERGEKSFFQLPLTRSDTCHFSSEPTASARAPTTRCLPGHPGERGKLATSWGWCVRASRPLTLLLSCVGTGTSLFSSLSPRLWP